jgi:uncharacterized protein DUF6766
MFGLFLVFLTGQSISGHFKHNEDQRVHGQREVGYLDYLGSGHFLEAVFENWESEFFQMGAYVFFTVFLFQRGSAESKDPDKREEVDRDPRRERWRDDAPWPVHRGGLALRIYEGSLSLALSLLFLASFALHGVAGLAEYNDERTTHGEPAVGLLGYFGSSRFWFESLQNWQSEFLSVGVLVVLSIFLRQRGSPESKPVAAPHRATGGD